MTIDNNKIYFNYSTIGPMREVSYNANKDFLDDFYRLGPPEAIYKYDHCVNELSIEVGKLLNCSPSEITYIKNTTEGIIIASETLPLKSEDEILISGNEYPANLLPWIKKKKDGVALQVIKETDSVEAFQLLINRINPKTKVISISTAQYYDGYMADMLMLSNICKARDIFLVVDAVQTVGIRNFDLKNTHADILVCGGQKYLCAGMGIGFMYINKNVISKLKDTKVGIRSMKDFDQDSYTLKDNASRFQDGTQNLAGIVTLHAAIRYLNSIGIETIEKQNYELLIKFKNCLRDYDIPYLDYGKQQSNIISMKVADPVSLFEFLKHRSVYIKPIKDIARISFTHESKIEDFETLAQLTRSWINSSL